MIEIASHKIPVSVKVGKRNYKEGVRYFLIHYFGKKPDGKPDRQYQYLKLDGFAKPKNQVQRAKNKQNEKFAQELADDIMAQVRANKYNRRSEMLKGLWLLEHMNNWADEKYKKPNSRSVYDSLAKHLREFMEGRDIKLSQVDKRFCSDFWNYLQTAHTTYKGELSDGSRKSYMKKFIFYLKQLENQDIIPSSPAGHIKVGKAISKPKQFCEKSELEVLENTPTAYEVIKRYYLFSSYSAITVAECQALTFGDFEKADTGDWYARVVREKTSKPARLKLSDKAISFIEPMGAPSEKVFPKLKEGKNTNDYLKDWIKSAGIEKNITPHTAKNNFAVMFYRKNKGNHIGTLMGLLQHNDLSSTQRYLKGLLDTEYESGNADIDF